MIYEWWLFQINILHSLGNGGCRPPDLEQTHFLVFTWYLCDVYFLRGGNMKKYENKGTSRIYPTWRVQFQLQVDKHNYNTIYL